MDILYVIKQIESASPISKRPSTPFRNSALFLSEVPCVSKTETAGTASEAVAGNPVYPKLGNSPFEPNYYEIYVGETFEILGLSEIYGKVKGFDMDTTLLSYDPETLEFKGLAEGYTTISVILETDMGSFCEHKVFCLVKEVVVPPVDPPTDPPTEPTDPPPDPTDPPDVPVEYVDIKCGQTTSSSGGAYQIFKTEKRVDPTTYTVRVQTYGVPDDIFVFLGDPLNGGKKIASRAIVDTEGNKYYYFDVEEADHTVYIQFNSMANENLGSIYQFELKCYPLGNRQNGWEEMGDTQGDPLTGKGRTYTGISCGAQIDSTGKDFTIYKLANTGTAGDYGLRINTLAVPDDVYVFLGDPKAGGQMIASDRIDSGGGALEYYFTVNDIQKTIYIQFNTPEGTSETTNYTFRLECRINNPDARIKLGNTLPNPY